MSRKTESKLVTDDDINIEANEPVAPATAALNTAIPKAPGVIIGLARMVERKWGVPEWLTLLAAWTGSEYTKLPGPRGNMLGIMAEGTEHKDEHGMAWFGEHRRGFDRFGWICSQLKLDYSDPQSCIEKLKTRCPKIATVSHTLFTEA